MRWTLLIPVLAWAGCDAPVGPEPEQPAPAFAPGDGDTDGADFLIWHRSLEGSGGIIIYDIQNGWAFDGSEPRNLLLNLHDNAIYDAANTTLLCRFDGEALTDAATGRVLFTTDGKVIYEGDTRVLRFSFKKERILEGSRRSAEVLGIASVDLTRVGVQRKLLLAALFSASCGAPPLDL